MIKRTVFVMVLVVLVYGGMLFYTESDKLLSVLGSYDLGLFMAVLALNTGNYVVRFFRWHYYLKRLDLHVPWVESAVVFVAGFSMTLTPAKAGEVLKSLLLHQRHEIPMSRTMPIVVAERITDLCALLLIAAVGALPFGVSSLVVTLLGTAVLMVLMANRPLGEWALGLCAKLPVLKRFSPQLRSVYETLRVLNDTKTFLVGHLLSTISWLFPCAALYVSTFGIPSVDLSMYSSLLIYSGPLVAGTLALLPGGLGVTEASMTGLINELGGPAVTHEAAVAIMVISRATSFWWAVFLGFAALAFWRHHYRH